MFTRLEIRNYQSLQKLGLDLAPFTVIVGASSSGKSSVFRAVGMLAFNARGWSYVTRGQTAAAVSVTDSDGWRATILRGEKANEYRLLLPDGSEKAYTKLGGAVPPQVAELLKLGDNSGKNKSLNFASQFDPPYLLTTSGSEVAQVLGALTNVTVIFKAAREARRLLQISNAELKAASEEKTRLSARVAEFADLPDHQRIVEHAESQCTTARALEARVQSLAEMISKVQTAEAALSSVRVPPDPPSLDAVMTAQSRMDSFRVVATQFVTAGQKLKQATAEVEQAIAAEADVEHKFREALTAAGACPLCGQSTKEYASHDH